MATKRQMRAEYKSACKRLEDLIQDGIKAGCDGPLPGMTELYHRITIIRQMLEWCHPPLVKTGKQGPYPDGACSRLEELWSFNQYFTLGPVEAETYLVVRSLRARDRRKR